MLLFEPGFSYWKKQKTKPNCYLHHNDITKNFTVWWKGKIQQQHWLQEWLQFLSRVSALREWKAFGLLGCSTEKLMQHSGGMKPIRFYESNERASAKWKQKCTLHPSLLTTTMWLHYYLLLLRPEVNNHREKRV